MKLTERIHRIKALLDYCPNEEVHVVDEKVGKCFADYINSHNDLQHCRYDTAYPTISLYNTFPTKDNVYALDFKYVYDADRDGEYYERYTFNDPEAIYEYDWLEPHHNLHYSDIPDDVWEIIEQWAFKEACKTINKGVEKAVKSLDWWKRKRTEFNTKYNIELENVKTI